MYARLDWTGTEITVTGSMTTEDDVHFSFLASMFEPAQLLVNGRLYQAVPYELKYRPDPGGGSGRLWIFRFRDAKPVGK
jgi:hypothetical protein